MSIYEGKTDSQIRLEKLRFLSWTKTKSLTPFMTPKQKMIHNLIMDDQHNLAFYVLCSRRFGKTFLDVCMGLGYCMRNPYSVVYIVGPEINQTLRMVHRQLTTLQRHYNMPGDLLKNLPTGLGHGWQLENKSELYITGFSGKSNPENSRGDGADLVLIEEARDFSPDYYYDVIEGIYKPMLSDRDGKIVYFTTPPADPNHPFIADMNRAKETGEGLVFKFTLEDNDRYSKEKKERIIRASGGRENIHVRREYFCEIVRDPQKMVIPAFNREKHVVDHTINTNSFYLIGGDLGGKRDKTAIFTLSVDEKSDLCTFVDERIFSEGTPSSKIIDESLHMEALWSLKNPPRFLDMTEQTRIDHASEHDYLSKAPEKVDKHGAITSFNDAIDRGNIVISSKCEVLAKALESVKYNKNRTDVQRSKEYGHGDPLWGAIYCYRMRKHAVSIDNRSSENIYLYPQQDPYNNAYIGISWASFNNPTVVCILSEKSKLLALSIFHQKPGHELTGKIVSLLLNFRDKKLTLAHNKKLISPAILEALESCLKSFGSTVICPDCKPEKLNKMALKLKDDVESESLDISSSHSLSLEAQKLKEDPDNYYLNPESLSLLMAHHALKSGDETMKFFAMITNKMHKQEGGLHAY